MEPPTNVEIGTRDGACAVVNESREFGTKGRLTGVPCIMEPAGMRGGRIKGLGFSMEKNPMEAAGMVCGTIGVPWTIEPIGLGFELGTAAGPLPPLTVAAPCRVDSGGVPPYG